MIGVIDVGGGLRGAYGAGVLDWCLDHNIHFDYGIGVSAGSANIASYGAGQVRRNYPFYIDYPFRKEFMSLKNIKDKHTFLDLDYVYRELSNSTGENPLDYKALCANPMMFKIVAYNCDTGKATYFDKTDMSQDQYDIFLASSALPIVTAPVIINGTRYYDGGLADPVPVEKALADGCDKVVLILTKPRDVIRDAAVDKGTVAVMRRSDPLAADNLAERAARYNVGVSMAKALEKEGRCLIVAPEEIGTMTTLSKDKEQIFLLYHRGYSDAEKIEQFVKG